MKRALAYVAVVAPLVVFAYLLHSPQANIDLTSPVEHLVTTTNVALLVFFAAVLVARAAVQLKQYRSTAAGSSTSSPATGSWRSSVR